MTCFQWFLYWTPTVLFDFALATCIIIIADWLLYILIFQIRFGKYRSEHVRERRVWLPRRNQRCILKLSTLRLKNFDERDQIQTVLACDDEYIYIIYSRYTSAAAPPPPSLILFRIPHPITELKNFSRYRLNFYLYYIFYAWACWPDSKTHNSKLPWLRK